jgi:T-complex protein 1 subunit theta
MQAGGISDVAAQGIYDVLGTKSNGIRLATDAAITVLRVDQIIMSKPAGGPKPPKQGPMDAD